MPEYTIDVVQNPWQTIVIVVAILVVLALPQILAWKNSSTAATHAKRAADEIEHQSKPNSGKSLMDSLNRIEATLEKQDVRLGELERQQKRPWWRS
jgi:cell division protein FtsX